MGRRLLDLVVQAMVSKACEIICVSARFYTFTKYAVDVIMYIIRRVYNLIQSDGVTASSRTAPGLTATGGPGTAGRHRQPPPGGRNVRVPTLLFSNVKRLGTIREY